MAAFNVVIAKSYFKALSNIWFDASARSVLLMITSSASRAASTTALDMLRLVTPDARSDSLSPSAIARLVLNSDRRDLRSASGQGL